MTRNRAIAVLLAFGSLAALPACSSMNGHPFTTSTAAPAPMPTPELSSSMVMQVQTTLQQQGLYKGNIDGLWGPATEAAVQSYQQAHGMTANGQLDQPTLAALNAPPMAPAAAATPPAAAAPPPPAATTSSAAPAAPAAAPATTTAATTAPAAPATQ